MSTAVGSTSAALGRPFLFDADPEPELHPSSDEKKPLGQQNLPITKVFHSKINNQQSTIPLITPASRLAIRPAPEMVTTGIPALDALTGGLPRGCLTEICGPASSGRTSVMLAALAAATRRGEYCAVIDANDALDPHSLNAAGIDLDRLLWVRCNENSPQRHRDTEKNNRENFSLGPATVGKGAASAVPYSTSNDAALAAEGRRSHLQQSFFKQPGTDQDRPRQHYYSDEDSRNRKQSERRLEQVLRATDLLLESGGFGLIILDLADLPHQAARCIPLTTWFRFRRAVEHKPTILLAIEQQPIAGSCSSFLLQLGSPIGRDRNSIKGNASDGPAAKRRKNTAHACPEQSRRGASRGWSTEDDQAPEGRKTSRIPGETPLDFPFPSHAHLLTELEIHAELAHSRLDRKPARSVTFETQTAWAG